MAFECKCNYVKMLIPRNTCTHLTDLVYNTSIIATGLLMRKIGPYEEIIIILHILIVQTS